jgi:hypothetical protein
MPIHEYACRELEKKLAVFATQGSTPAAPMGCGTCGDPRGPGACKLN